MPSVAKSRAALKRLPAFVATRYCKRQASRRLPLFHSLNLKSELLQTLARNFGTHSGSRNVFCRS